MGNLEFIENGWVTFDPLNPKGRATKYEMAA
jgi:hypothetical protein